MSNWQLKCDILKRIRKINGAEKETRPEIKATVRDARSCGKWRISSFRTRRN